MKAITFTTRNVTAGERNTAGEMVLRHLGNVTVTLEAMTRAELAEWEWATDALNTRGWDEELFRLTVNGWKVIHPQAGVVGLLFQGAGTRVHVEWYDVANDDYFSAGWASGLGMTGLRHGAAQIVHARQHAGQGLPVDVAPQPVKAPTVKAPVWLDNGTPVRYHGTFAMTFADLGISDFRVYGCDYGACDCNGYELRIGWQETVAVHVSPDSVTALEHEPAVA
jgi:hypothetical protein